MDLAQGGEAPLRHALREQLGARFPFELHELALDRLEGVEPDLEGLLAMMERNYFVVGLILVTFFVISFLTNIIGPLVPEIIEDFGLTFGMDVDRYLKEEGASQS